MYFLNLKYACSIVLFDCTIFQFHTYFSTLQIWPPKKFPDDKTYLYKDLKESIEKTDFGDILLHGDEPLSPTSSFRDLNASHKEWVGESKRVKVAMSNFSEFVNKLTFAPKLEATTQEQVQFIRSYLPNFHGALYRNFDTTGIPNIPSQFRYKGE